MASSIAFKEKGARFSTGELPDVRRTLKHKSRIFGSAGSIEKKGLTASAAGSEKHSLWAQDKRHAGAVNNFPSFR